MKAVDLFAGWGGMTLGAEAGGARVVWAGNHKKRCVEIHKRNHPHAHHVVQDLQQADWTSLPAYGLLLAGPACQGHSYGGQPGRKRNIVVARAHDGLRGTAWAVVDCAYVTRPKAIVVENVPPFEDWELFRVWVSALEVLGYHVQTVKLWASHHGVPQRRRRLFVIATLKPVRLGLLEVAKPEGAPETPFGPFLDRGADGWRPITSAAPGAQRRILRARARLGRRFLSQHVTDHPGVPLTEPIRTITTAPQHWLLVDGERYRYLTGRELARGMGFPDTFTWPEDLRVEDVTMGLGNAVPPPLATVVVRRVLDALC